MVVVFEIEFFVLAAMLKSKRWQLIKSNVQVYRNLLLSLQGCSRQFYNHGTLPQFQNVDYKF
ncbi:MAG: hypothetical protein CLLPBCKN_000225 [Chroococcidiopsis cubana SAG 39.79]|jgi:hypothetical protein|nr:hypothetical protein [Chroococcidiopsis cubana SAG 39.79]